MTEDYAQYKVLALVLLISSLLIAPVIPIVNALSIHTTSYTNIYYINSNNINIKQIKNLINTGKIIVIRGYVSDAAKIRLPTMIISKKIVSKDIDPVRDVAIDIKVKDLGTKVIKPTYIFYIAYKDRTGVIKEYVFLTQSFNGHVIQKVNSEGELALRAIIAQKLGTTTNEYNRYTSRMRPVDYYATENVYWIKKDEIHYTWVLNDKDELYTRYEIYELNQIDSSNGKEYWRIDAYIDHNLGSYVATNSLCGPYIHQRTIYINAGEELYRYGPKTTASDRTVHVNIGFSISTSGGSVGVSYGWSWNNPGVSYAVSAYYSQHNVKWTESFRGPDYGWYPWYSQPTSAAHNSYYAMPSAVFRTSYEAGLSVNKLESTWTVYTDHLSFRGVYLHIDRDIVTYNVHWTSLYYGSSF